MLTRTEDTRKMKSTLLNREIKQSTHGKQQLRTAVLSSFTDARLPIPSRRVPCDYVVDLSSPLSRKSFGFERKQPKQCTTVLPTAQDVSPSCVNKTAVAASTCYLFQQVVCVPLDPVGYRGQQEHHHVPTLNPSANAKSGYSEAATL